MTSTGLNVYRPRRITVAAVLLNPFVTGSLVWTLVRARPDIKARTGYKALLKILKALLVCGTLKRINARLNSIALNHWRVRTDRSKWNWTEEVAVVTGGCSGFGLLVTERLVRRGVRVAIVDIAPLPDRLAGPNVFYQKCDITDPDAVLAAAAVIKKHFGRSPSILYNNAGMIQSGSVLSTPPAKIAKLVAVNMTSHFYTCQAWVPDMVKKDKGHVVTMASMASYATVASTTDYAVSKAGKLAFHEGLTAALRNEYKAPGVLTTSIHPKWAMTPLLANQSKESLASLGPLLEPDYIADAVSEAIFSCRGGQKILPPSLSLSTGLKGWPNYLQELVRDSLSGAKI